jgi:hypothetical protein
MTNKDYKDKVEDLTAEQIAEGIFNKIVTFDELRKTGNFEYSKQKKVKEILRGKDDDAFNSASTIEQLQNYLSTFVDGNHVAEANDQIKALLNEEDDNAFSSASTIEQLQNYLSAYPNGTHIAEAHDRINQIRYDIAEKERIIIERQRTLAEIRGDINKDTPDEVRGKLSHEDIIDLCNGLNIDPQIIFDWKETDLDLTSGTIPNSEADIPNDFTDVFFWGIPSSGKTCALSLILNTMNKQYTIADPVIPKKFGTTYRKNLINNIFIKGHSFGYLPDSTAKDKTQYMPFLLKRIGENNYRKISFFELSGEVFKYFYDKVYDTDMSREDETQTQIEIGFKTLNMLLNSKNQKIHFFFIDYNQETKGTIDKYGLSQSDYLQAAATYFRDYNDIFRNKTDAVYIVLTKSDEIRGANRAEIAKSFLQNNFSGFIDAMKTSCKKDSIDFHIKMFSIGDVYFKRICKINREYATDIIEELIKRIDPENNNKLKKFFNK